MYIFPINRAMKPQLFLKGNFIIRLGKKKFKKKNNIVEFFEPLRATDFCSKIQKV